MEVCKDCTQSYSPCRKEALFQQKQLLLNIFQHWIQKGLALRGTPQWDPRQVVGRFKWQFKSHVHQLPWMLFSYLKFFSFLFFEFIFLLIVETFSCRGGQRKMKLKKKDTGARIWVQLNHYFANYGNSFYHYSSFKILNPSSHQNISGPMLRKVNFGSIFETSHSTRPPTCHTRVRGQSPVDLWSINLTHTIKLKELVNLKCSPYNRVYLYPTSSMRWR